MRLAVVGSGMIVRDFLPVARDVPGLELAAIVGRPGSRGRLEALAEEFGIAAVHVDYDDCLADPGVDTVWIALPNSLHFDHARRALLAGRHVICEKPFVLDVAEFDELRDLAQRSGLILAEAITTVHLPNYRWIARNLARVGEVRLVQCEYSQLSSRYAAFRRGDVMPAFDPSMGGGALLDIGIYTLHLVIGLLGRPRSVSYTPTVERGVDTSGVVVLQYDGCVAVCTAAKDSGGPNRSKIQGSAGAIVMDGPPNACPSVRAEIADEPVEVVQDNTHPHRMVEEFREFERMIRDGDLTARDAGLEHSRMVLEVAAAALSSAGIRLGVTAAGHT